MTAGMRARRSGADTLADGSPPHPAPAASLPMKDKTTFCDVIRHPFAIILSTIAIAYGGYFLFGRWLHALVS
ncbi:hypothetical protein [Pseudoxanthomonas suwonensis]|uniref:hypothetical protein n=1 Tax=Pseudoxanthomonas suwonensis TaxID=314722 RepID=UPI000A97FF25|nr:hypothetical protein [Pseudoxanthomonas suwonensis]